MSHATINKQEYQLRLRDMLVWGLGPEICELLDDPTVIEIMLNPSGELWIERLGSPMEQFGRMDSVQAESLMGNIASQLNEKINAQSPILECELPLDGSRFEGLLPPVVTAPTFAIRKKAISVFTLEEYVKQGILSNSFPIIREDNNPELAKQQRSNFSQKEVIENAAQFRKNILIAGGTGSGKTTLTNAIIRHIVDIHPGDRLIILEDTRELQCSAKNFVSMRSVDGVSMTRLLKAAMRLRPDRIIVGEVRDGAALAMLKAWNTGHPGGVATIHANSALESLIRVEDLTEEATQFPKPRLIAAAIDLIIFIEKHQGSRRIKEMVQVDGYDGQQYLTESIGG